MIVNPININVEYIYVCIYIVNYNNGSFLNDGIIHMLNTSLIQYQKAQEDYNDTPNQ